MRRSAPFDSRTPVTDMKQGNLRTGELPDAFEAALRAGRVALVELRIDPEPITARATLAQIRGAGVGA